MPEIRKNPITGDPILLSPDRSDRPGAWTEAAVVESQEPACPFCPGNEDQTPPELERVGGDEWSMRVVPNKYPAIDPYDGIPAHEVIIDSANHDLCFEDFSSDSLAGALALWQRRAMVHAKREGCAYVAVFRNDGRLAGQSIPHPHAQLQALPHVPTRVARELTAFEAATGCPLCDALGAEIEDTTRVVEARNGMVTLAPPWSRMPFELLITSIDHESDWTAIDPVPLASALSYAVRQLRLAVPEVDFNLAILTAPVAETSSRNRFHWYAELLPRLTNLAGYELSTGNWINILDPDAAAARLRAVGQAGLK